MQIKWNNLILAAMILLTLIVLAKAPSLIDLALLPLHGLTGRDRAFHPTVDDYTAGLIALSLICVTIVGVCRMLIVSRHRRDD